MIGTKAGEALLAAYESRGQTAGIPSRQHLLVDCLILKKLWKIVNFYYTLGKAWIPEKSGKNLDRLLEQETARKKISYGILETIRS